MNAMRGVSLLVVLVLALPAASAFPSGGHLAAQTTSWTLLGSAPVDGGGSWRFNAEISQDLIASGLTFVRATSAQCATDPATLFEANLLATQAGNGSWEGVLSPIGGLALSGGPIIGGDV